MCGFVGVIALHGGIADASLAQSMAETLRHRGPDDRGVYASGPVAFGFRRLSILDLSPSGHQPFVSEDGDLVLVFNGEIYNYVELRQELATRGHRFRSMGDTEVLLHAYREWGRECLPKLNGMWAFLVYDRRRGVVFGSRDRFGVKPLYCHRGRDYALFASEIKGILASRLCEPRTNWRRAAHLLCRGDHSVAPSSRETYFEDITEIPAGSAFEVAMDGCISEWRFWSLDAISPEPVADPPKAFAELFEDAVRLRMRSDVPVGVSLSGGLDSTSIAAAMARLLAQASPGGTAPPRLKAFSYMSPEFDESEYIALSVEQTGAELHRVEVPAGALWTRLDEVLRYHDEPLHSATALIGFEIYRLASAHGVKVVLTGQGADEVIGGYPSYFLDHWCDLARHAGGREAWREISAYCAAHGQGRFNTVRKVLERSAKEEMLRFAPLRALAARRRRRRDLARATWFTRELADALPQEVERGNGSLDASLRWSIEAGSLPMYLRIEDRNSMAHSVEARLPFMDYRLVLLMFRLSASWKLRGPWNKFVLREAMRGRIPERVRTRPDKMGFPTSVAEWFRGPLYDGFQDTLNSEAVRSRGIYKIPAIRADLERHRRGEIDAASALFNVAQFERWMQTPSVSAVGRT